MREKIVEKWEPIRFVIYGVCFLAAGVQWFAGRITADEAQAWTANVEDLVYAAGFLLAARYVPKPGSEPAVEPAGGSSSIADVRARLAAPAGDLEEAVGRVTVDELRRRLGR
ncbi:hypothetical protein [Rhodococcus sp. PD04]|uniref:hypothetical protein n=1 Tax=Rhodococcus sp. PD04 TaxID=3109594 RepID=UPI002DDC8049|nr:hypothetical protein [Rhodococcus sp. PD04]WSE22316.1 hypothetical protein U9J23_22120 [Rhodococcus sp. PD04]